MAPASQCSGVRAFKLPVQPLTAARTFPGPDGSSPGAQTAGATAATTVSEPATWRRAPASCAQVCSACSSNHRSASMAAMQPVPAAVTAWRYRWSATSPAAKTPSTVVAVVPRGRQHITLFVQAELVSHNVGVGDVPDGDEQTGHRRALLPRRSGRSGASGPRPSCHPGPPSTTLSQTNRIFGLATRAVLHDLGGPQFSAPVDDGDRLGELGQEDRLLEG